MQTRELGMTPEDLIETASSTAPKSFYNDIFTPAPSLATSRYNRQLLIPSVSINGQTRISQTRALIIGLGGLGCPAALYLAGSGVHTLGLLDHDVVEASNLHRQIAHRESSVNISDGISDGSASPMTKVASAHRACRELNSEINYEVYEVRLSGQNAIDIIGRYDVVLDCTDNPATRYLISDVCVVLDKTLVSGAAQRLEGQLMVLNHDARSVLSSTVGTTSIEQKRNEEQQTSQQRGPCYRCIFPVPPSPEVVQGCSEIGILGPVVGTIGTLMASETLRLIVRPEEIRKPTMLLYNAWSEDPRGTFRVIGLRGKRKDCVVCGDTEVLRGRGKDKINASSIRQGHTDYVAFCGTVEAVRLLEEQQRISAEEFLRKLNMTGHDTNNGAVVVDVREIHEVDIGPKIEGSTNIPMSEFLASETGHDTVDGAEKVEHKLIRLSQQHQNSPVIFVCQQGNDSQIAAKRLIDKSVSMRDGVTNPGPQPWIGDVAGGFVAIEAHLRGR